MSGPHKGFTFIEMIVAILIIGIMAAIVVPSFRHATTSPIDAFATELNALIQTGVLEAVRTDKVHRIFFDFKNGRNRVTLEVAGQKAADPKMGHYLPVSSVATTTSFDIPAELVPFRHFYIGTLEETNIETIYFFIGPDGSVQDVTIVLTDPERALTRTLMTNPFSGQLVMYDGAKKP